MLDEPNPQPDLDTSIAFLKALRPRGPWNLTAIAPDGPVHSATFTDPSACRAWLAKHVDHANLHFVANPAANPSGAGGRVRKQDMDRIEFVHGDFDLDKLPAGHALASAGISQRKSAVEFDMEMQSMPSLLVDSGGGLQGLWRLAEPLEATPENIELVEGKNRWLAQEFPGGEPQCADAGHLLRLPGSLNLPNAKKRARGRTAAPARLLRNTDQVHGLEEFGFVPAPAKAEIDITFDAPEEVDIETLGLSGRLLTIINDGYIEGKPKAKDDSYSAWMFDGVCGMLRHGVVPEQILWIITDPENGISHSIRKKPESDQLRYAEKQVRDAMRILAGDTQVDIEAMGPVDPAWLEGDAKPGPKREPRFKRYSILELLDLPDPVWTVERLLMERSFAMLYGAPKSYKTFVALDLALCIATGRAFHGHEVIRGIVTYIAAEGNPGETRNRVLVWCKENGLRPEELDGWFKLVTTGPHLDEVEVVKEFLREDPEPCAVTFVDTVNRSMAGDESATKDMTAFVAGCDAVRRVLQTMVVAVHHSGVNQERERGSTVLRAAVDTRLRVTQKGTVVTMEVEDQRAGEGGEKLYLQPVSTLVRDFDGPASVVLRSRDAPAPKETPKQRQTAEDTMLLRIDLEKPARYADLQDEAVAGFSQANIYKVKRRLIDANLLKATDRPTLTKAGKERVKELSEPEIDRDATSPYGGR